PGPGRLDLWGLRGMGDRLRPVDLVRLLLVGLGRLLPGDLGLRRVVWEGLPLRVRGLPIRRGQLGLPDLPGQLGQLGLLVAGSGVSRLRVSPAVELRLWEWGAR